MLSCKSKKINSKIELHVIDVKSLGDEITAFLDKHVVQICEGDSGSELELVKARFINFLESKDDKTRIGAVAEFFVHLYMRQCGFKQDFLFLNLEEGSIKKGFDGYFSKKNFTYIVESKSGSVLTKNISHKAKLKEAYNDLKAILAGEKSSNNPWRNAYNHASHIDAAVAKPIRRKIKELSDSFDKKKFGTVDEFNIVPCSTIFLKEDWDDALSNAILQEPPTFYAGFEAKTIMALCITKSSYQVFVEYLQGGE